MDRVLRGVSSLRGVIFYASAVSLFEFRTLTLWYRVGSSSCGLNNIPLVPKLRLPLLRRHFVVFLRYTCCYVPTYHGVVRAEAFLHACTIVCVFVTVCLHNLRNYSLVLFGNDALRFGIRGLLDLEFHA